MTHTPSIEISHPDDNASLEYKVGFYKAEAEWMAKYAQAHQEEVKRLQEGMAYLQSR